MSNAIYLLSATNETYSGAAVGYVTEKKDIIADVSTRLGISPGAIAGAMAEEAHSYYSHQWLDDTLDKYALSGIDPNVASVTLSAAAALGAVALAAWEAANLYQLNNTRRSHEQSTKGTGVDFFSLN